MLKKQWTLAVLILMGAMWSTIAHAALSKEALEAVGDQHVVVTMDDDRIIQGRWLKIGDTTAIFVHDSGDVEEWPIARTKTMRLVSATQSARDTPPSPPPSTPPSPVLPDAQPSSYGYLPPPSTYDDGSWLGDTSFMSRSDYSQYQDMRRSSRIQRGMGWTLVAVGALTLVSAWSASQDAYVNQRSVRAGATMGFITTFVGLPIAIAGRQQYQKAEDFAEEAAERYRDERAMRSGRRPVVPFSPTPPSTVRPRPTEGMSASPATISGSEAKTATPEPSNNDVHAKTDEEPHDDGAADDASLENSEDENTP